MTFDEILKKLEESGYQHRDNQIAMMQAVSVAVKNKQIAVIEGGTGIGKTFAYLIPALLNKPSKVKIVVATATVSLQEQLINKDLPTVLKMLGIAVNAQLAKGRRRFVCNTKLYHYAYSHDQQNLSLFGVEETEIHKPDQETLKLVAKLIGKLEAKTWQGDRDELEFSVAEPIWAQLTTDAAGCSNRRCSHFHQCAFFQAKRRLQQADIVIANHDLLLADIGLGTGALLPKAEESIYIIDEAHHLPQKAINHFAASSTLMGSRDWLESLSKSIKQLHSKVQFENSQLEQINKFTEQLRQDLSVMRDLIIANYEQFAKEDVWVLKTVPEAMKELVQPLAQSAQQLLNYLTYLRKNLMESHNDKTFPEFEASMVALAWFIGRVEMLYRTWTLFGMEVPENQAPIARWISPREQIKNKKFLGQDFVCHAAMTSGANMLPTYFWDKLTQGAILCSATLRALGKFDDFLEKTGLNFYPHVTTHAFASPFFYQQSSVIIPKMQHTPEGRESDLHAKEVGKLLPKILREETRGVLVLFTSKWLLEEVYAAMPSDLLPAILKQSDLPKQLLLDAHRKQVDKQQLSIIFGMQSFAEGVDLPGDYCRHVIITKLPFAVPSTPIEKVRVEWLEGQGRNAFMEHSLPEASIRLTQFAGRLIRSETDVGKITILDRRIVTKRYGLALLNNLPPFQRIIE